MEPIRRQSVVEQAAAQLREGFSSGRWSGYLPGVIRLAEELGISKNTLRDVLHLLEAEGLIKDSGAGKRREIVGERGLPGVRKSLRVGIFLKQPLEGDNSWTQRVILGIKQKIESAGHVCFFAEKPLSELGYNTSQLPRVVKRGNADAWVVYSCTREVLEWFAGQPLPVCALGGNSIGLSLGAGVTDAGPVLKEIVRKLTASGHRRIVLLSPSSWRVPALSAAATNFLKALKEHGVSSSDYNLPNWDETPEKLERRLESLFRVTPPTALVLVEPLHCIGTMDFLARRGIRIPQDLSLVCLVLDPMLAWYRPELAHLVQPLAEHVNRISRWVDAVSRGITDVEHEVHIATFEEGGSMGPAGKSS